MRLLRILVILVILLLGGLAGYAYFGDMDAAPVETRSPVQLDLGAEVPAEAEESTATASPAAGESAPDTGAAQLD